MVAQRFNSSTEWGRGWWLGQHGDPKLTVSMGTVVLEPDTVQPLSQATNYPYPLQEDCLTSAFQVLVRLGQASSSTAVGISH